MKINVGILGGAKIAEKSIIPSLAAHDSFEIVALASSSKSEYMANKYDFPVYSDYHDILSLEEVDIIYIALPTSMHFELAWKAIEFGKSVWCEKSLVENYQDAISLVNFAEKNSKFIFESFQFRFHSQIQWIADTIQNKKLGEIRLFRSFFGFPPFEDAKNIRYQKSLGGGALLDAGAYTIKAATVLLGCDLQVLTSSMHFSEMHEVDIYGAAQLKSGSGDIDIQVSYGFDNFYQNGVELWCSEGKLFTNRLFTAPSDLSPCVEITLKDGLHIHETQRDDHFRNMLNHIARLHCDESIHRDEHLEILTQSRIINDIRIMSNGR
jgi:dTDP-3,4-didehydro-2,6-dideoxy-alpha-D-glucose 3-reductase